MQASGGDIPVKKRSLVETLRAGRVPVRLSRMKAIVLKKKDIPMSRYKSEWVKSSRCHNLNAEQVSVDDIDDQVLPFKM